MAQLRASFTGYYSVATALGNRQEKIIGNATTLVRLSDTRIALKLFGNTIAIWNNEYDTLTITDATWQTRTTKDRLNQVLVPQGAHIASKTRKGITKWVLYTNNAEEPMEEGDMYTLSTVSGKLLYTRIASIA